MWFLGFNTYLGKNSVHLDPVQVLNGNEITALSIWLPVAEPFPITTQSSDIQLPKLRFENKN